MPEGWKKNITGMLHVNVNCSNYEKSREFYAMLGYRVMWKVAERAAPKFSAADGMPPYTVRGASPPPRACSCYLSNSR